MDLTYTIFLSIIGGGLVAAMGLSTAYWFGRMDGYREGRAETWEDADRFLLPYVEGERP